MTDQEINIAIAEACGWSRVELKSDAQSPNDAIIIGVRPGYPNYPNPARFTIPSYTTDLNAMHEAWLHMEDYNQREFHVQLGCVIKKKKKKWDDLQLLDQRGLIANATARQRAEAFLHTIRKWKEEASNYGKEVK